MFISSIYYNLYHIVEFVKEKTYELVHSHWLVTENLKNRRHQDLFDSVEECYFPPGGIKETLTKYLKRKTEVKKKWGRFPIKVIKTVGKYSTT